MHEIYILLHMKRLKTNFLTSHITAKFVHPSSKMCIKIQSFVKFQYYVHSISMFCLIQISPQVRAESECSWTGKSELVKQLKTFQVNVNFEKDTNFLVKIIIIVLKISSFLQVSLKKLLVSNNPKYFNHSRDRTGMQGELYNSLFQDKNQVLTIQFLFI